MYPSQEIHLITGGNVDHLVKMMSARFIHGKAAIFLFQLINLLKEDTLILCKYLFLLKLSLTDLASIGRTYL